MGRKKYVAKLKEHARRTGSELKYEEGVPKESDSGTRFILTAVVNGQHFPIGVGENIKKAKESAARNALRSLSEKENQRPETEKCPVASVCQKSITKPKPSLLSEHGQMTSRLKSRITTPCCSPLVGDEEYPVAPGTTKSNTNEEAAKVSSCSTVSEDVEPHVLESGDLSNPPETQDAVISEGMNTANCTVNTEILRNKTEFDSIKLLGKGSFGHVYMARHKLLKKCYAIKIVTCKETGKALREVEALSELNHCNIIRYYSCWMEDTGCQLDSSDDSGSTSQSDSSSAKYLYIQMDLCDTKTLRHWIDEKNSVETSLRNSKRREESLAIFQQIVRGVEYIHSKKFIHRDLKPANILFGRDREVKIGDFGLVTTENDHSDENLERTLNKGSPWYMAPEQESEKTYDRKVDIFPLGLIYFELLWYISTVHERAKLWDDIRRQIFPAKFSHHFLQECSMIRSMLSVKPEDRPEASKLKTELKEFKRILNVQDIVRRGSRTV